ncbi:MAG: hypothetical protein IJA46_09430 [Bacteroidaceae bacterium]|nr:hypothetical protein [Bacteroidaceae bacterium]
MEKTVKIFILAFFLLLFAACSHNGNRVSQGCVGRYFIGGKALLHCERTLIGVLPVGNSLVGDSLFFGPVRIEGCNGDLRCGVEERGPLSEHIRMLCAKDVMCVDDSHVSCYLLELKSSDRDTLLLKFAYSYSISGDSVVEIVEGSLCLPFVRGAGNRHHRLRPEEYNILPLREITPAEGETQRLLIDVGRLLL